jgi:hypothetical protein
LRPAYVRGMNDEDDELARMTLVDWPREAEAKVISITRVASRAEVGIQVATDYEYWVYYLREESGLWRETISSNARCDGWSDPSVIRWE